MHEDVRAAKPNIKHAEWVTGHAPDLTRAVLTGTKADVLAIARCVHNALRVDLVGRFQVWTDRELVKLVTASWHDRNAEAEPIDEKIVWPHVLAIWIGSLRDGPKASADIVLDALKVRREERHATWLAYTQRAQAGSENRTRGPTCRSTSTCTTPSSKCPAFSESLGRRRAESSQDRICETHDLVWAP